MPTPPAPSRLRRALAFSACAAATAALAVAAATAVSARAANWSSSACPYGCEPTMGVGIDERIREVRAALVAKRAKLPTRHARTWLDNAVASLDAALAPQRWDTGGVVDATPAGLEGLRDVRLAVGRLAWADESLKAATLTQRTELVDGLSDVALGRFNAVWAMAGPNDPATRNLLWKAEDDIHKGERDFFVNRVRSSLAFIRAWQRLLGQPR